MKYPSRKDWWLTFIVWGAMIFAFGSGIASMTQDSVTPSDLITTGFATFVIPIFVIWLWLTTYYVIDEKHLIIKYGPFKKKVLLDSIKLVKKTMNPLSSPALSLKRLEIQYGQFNRAIISPMDRDEFMDILEKKCPYAKIIRT